MESKIPEAVVLLNEIDHQVFTDICIIGEVPPHVIYKCSIENCELDHNTISNMLKDELANSSTAVSEEVHTYISTNGDSYTKDDCIKDDVQLSGAGNNFMEDKADSGASDEIADAHSEDKNISQRLINFSCTQTFNSDDLRDEQEDNQDPSTKAILADSFILRKEVYSNDSNTTINIKGTGRIRHSSDSLLTMTLREKSKEIAEVEQLSEDDKMSDKEDTVSKNSVPSLSSQSNVGLPEYESSIFSAARPPSGLTFSGSVPYSDSMSLHSNSTSTRSFAFPILATEWSESPVRMAEADRRRLKKTSYWRMCFTCCTF